MICQSKKVEEAVKNLPEDWSLSDLDISYDLIEATERAYEVMERIAGAPNLTYFWDGNHYITFFLSEHEVLQKLEQLAKEIE